LLADELGSSAVLLSPHRLTPPPPGAKSGHHGEFNAGFVAFQRSKGGMEPLQWWCERVLEWCRDEVQGELFADQGYLTVMAREFRNIGICRNPGVNVAPWNLDERQNAHVIFVHFHGLRRLGYFLCDTGTPPYRVEPTGEQIRTLFRPYMRELKNITHWLRKEHGYDPPGGSIRRPSARIGRSPLLLLSRLRRRQWLLSPVY
jgi:hypothetical protein